MPQKVDKGGRKPH